MRADFTLTDLKNRERSTSKLMNVKIPAHLNDAIQSVARDLHASKTEVVIALLNEGLEASALALKGWHSPRVAAREARRLCTVEGCRRAYAAKGYCATHYQAARRGTLYK
jgi:hypothetical protein